MRSDKSTNQLGVDVLVCARRHKEVRENSGNESGGVAIETSQLNWSEQNLIEMKGFRCGFANGYESVDCQKR